MQNFLVTRSMEMVIVWEGYFYSMGSDGTQENNNCRHWCNNNSSCLSFDVWNGICFFKNIGCGNNVKLGGHVILYTKQGIPCHVLLSRNP